MKEVRELIKLLYGCLRVDETSVIAQNTIGSNQHVIGDRVSKDFNSQSISDDLFRLFIQVRVNQGNVVIACDTISQGRQFFFNSDHLDIFIQTISDIPELVISCIVRHQ